MKLSRSTSSSKAVPTGPVAQPTVPHHESNAFVPYEMADSADPFIGDMIYRLDDQRAEHQNQQPGQDDRVAAAQGLRKDQQQQPNNSSPAAASPTTSSNEPTDHLAWFKDMPWWKRPAVWWLVPLASLLAIGSGATLSSKVELFTQIVCEELMISQDTTAATGGSAAGFSALESLIRLPLERPPMSSACRTNPDVIAGSATLQLKVTMSMGLLSALTTGFWGGLSDRRGRTKVLGISLFGVLLVDASFLAVGLLPVSSLPGGTHFLLLSAAAEGMLGGLATIIAAHQAYISDCTPSGTRAKVYTQLAGFFYCGFVIGPALGGYMVKALNSLMVTFVLGACTHLLYFLLVLLVVPESTNPERRKAAMKEYYKSFENGSQGEDGEYAIRLPEDAEERSGRQYSAKSTKNALLRRLATPVRPLAMLLPRPVDEFERLQSRPATPMPSLSHLRTAASNVPSADPTAASSHISVSHISRARKRDWNLSLLSLAYGLEMSCMGILSVKALYAQEVFDWGASELGFFMTATALARVLCLTIILPVIIRVWHRPPKSVALPQDSGNEASDTLDDEGRTRRRSSVASAPSLSGSSMPEEYQSDSDLDEAPPAEVDPSHEATVEELWTMRAKQLRLLHDSHFDLKLARYSLGVNIIAYTLLSTIHGPSMFVFGTLLTALGGGGGASMSSLALAILQEPNQAGKLFGAWSILSAIFSTIIGPLFFTWVFRLTVHTAPYAFFWAGLFTLTAAGACLAAVRIRKPKSLPGLPPRPRRRNRTSTNATSSNISLDTEPRRSVFEDDVRES
ncbi:unnamed protein product [Sympodiomycopsis kandeliae]